MSTIKILLVDDNKDKDNFFEPLADLASNMLKANLIQAYTFDEMSIIFEEEPYEYQAVILDGKGQKNDKSKVEDDGFLTTALRWIQQKNRQGVYIPYVIYSGYAEELKKYYSDEPIFWKGKSEEGPMFEHLREKIQSGRYYSQTQKYPDLFELFSLGLINPKYKLDLVRVAEIIADEYTGNSEDALRSLRPILENTLNKLAEFDSTLFTTNCFKRDKISLYEALLYLAGSPKPVGEETVFQSSQKIPQHIYYLAELVRKVTNNGAMHDYQESSSSHLVKSCVYALVEYLFWYKKFVKSQNYI